MKRGRPKADASKKAESKLGVKKKASEKESKRSKKAAKDPNKPKRPPSAFFVFMEEFRKQYKEKNPNNKSVAAVGKAGGEKWKSMPDSEKAPYVAQAEKRKSEYTKNIAAYNKKQAGGSSAAEKEEEEESDKSKSEVHDGEDDEDGSGDDDGEEDEDE